MEEFSCDAGLPSEVCDQIVHDIGNFSLALFGVSESPEGEGLHFVGSGTFVAVMNSHYILTAAHVWKALQSHESKRIAITLMEHHDQRFLIAKSTIVDHASRGPAQSEEWGPDLSFLRVPPAYVGKIQVYRTFYNLTKRKQGALQSAPDIQKGLWVLIGAPEAYGTFTTTHASLQIAGHFSCVDEVHSRGELDYLDVGADLSMPDLPQSFGGLSGGGLWQVLLCKSPSTGQFCWDGAINLEGVAFYESPPRDGRRIIRCHGRRSIYGTMPDRKPAA